MKSLKLDYLSKEERLNWGKIIVGTCLYVFGVKVFLQPAGMYSGGITGIAQILDTLLTDRFGLSFGNWDLVGILYFVINLPLLLLAYYTMGKRFVTKTVICVILNSVLMSIIPRAPQPIMEDVLTSCLIAGIIAGAGVGLILGSGASSGGLDVLGVYYTKKYKDISVGRLSMFINAIIFTACLFLFDAETAIYSIIYVTFNSFMVDRVYTQVINVEAIIITKSDGKAISKYIMKKFQRGVTYWDGTGAYTDEPVKVLYTALSKYEAGILRRHIVEYDPDSFVVLKEGGIISGRFPRHM